MLKRLQIRDMTRCQKYLVPAVLSGQNVTLVEGPGAGKTVGVLISLVSLMWRTSKGVSLTRTIVFDKFTVLLEMWNLTS